MNDDYQSKKMYESEDDSQAITFCQRLSEIARECGLSSIEYNSLGIIMYHFRDGSGVGCLRAHREANLISEKK